MDEELFDPSGGRAQSGRGPFLPEPGPVPAPPAGEPDRLLPDRDASRLGPAPNEWPVWSGFVVLLAALVIAAVGGLIVDIPALLLGV
ncbi:MAG TPA: hypothetical protein VGP18_14150, partial [Solirubrobacteraceae bacterium]|nr:hypothetical protein [Solirubrobacteraceae bacterium]